MALVNLTGNFLCISLIRSVGRRRLYLFTLVGCAVSCFAIGITKKVLLFTNIKLINIYRCSCIYIYSVSSGIQLLCQSSRSTNVDISCQTFGSLYVLCFGSIHKPWSISNHVYVAQRSVSIQVWNSKWNIKRNPYLLQFYFRTRGMATGLVVALSYLISFVSVKTFYSLDQLLSIGGCFALYGSISVIGYNTHFLCSEYVRV